MNKSDKLDKFDKIELYVHFFFGAGCMLGVGVGSAWVVLKGLGVN